MEVDNVIEQLKNMGFDESDIRSTISMTRSLDVSALVESLVSRGNQGGEGSERADAYTEQNHRDFRQNIDNLFEELFENLTGAGK